MGSPVFSLWVLILNAGRSWDAEVLGRDQTHTKSFIALRPQEEAVDITSGLQAQGFLEAEDTMG